MPLLWLSLALISGILLADNIALPFWLWVSIAIAALLLWLMRATFLHNSRLFNRLSSLPDSFHIPISLFALCFALSIGALRFLLSQPDFTDPSFIAHYNDQASQITLEGNLVEPPDQRDRYTNLRIETSLLKTAERTEVVSVSGLVLARVPAFGEWHYGDRLQISGMLQTPPTWEDFSYRDYLASQGIYAYMPKANVTWLASHQGNPLLAWIYALQERTLQTIYRIFPDPEASLLAGILVGFEKGIPEYVRQAFNDTGTAHIIAISGFNITVLAGLFMAILGRLLGRWRGAVVTIIAIGVYTVLVGADACVVRAALMGGLSVFALQLGRRQHGLNSLALVAAVMTLFNPKVLWDVGFQLSFAATLGLVLYSGPFTRAFVSWISRFLPQETAQKLAIPFGAYFLFTIAAQLTTLPLIIYHFNRLSLISFVANPVILPVQPLVMVLGGLATLLGILYLPIGQLAAWLAWPFVSFTIRAVEFFAQFHAGVFILDEGALPLLLALYAALFLLTFAGERLHRLAGALTPSLGLASLTALTVLIWRVALAAPDGRLHMYLLDVSAEGNSGEAMLVQSPQGRFILIGGGSSPSRLSDALGSWLPLHDRKLDWLVVAGSKQNQLAALPRMIERYPPSQVLWAAPQWDTSSVRSLTQALAEQQIPITYSQVGQTFDLGEGARLTVLALDDYGGTLLIEQGSFRLLLPIGIDHQTLERLQADPSLTPVTVLLLADRGRDWLNPPEWIDKLQPGLLLISVAAGDWDGLPAAETLQRLQGYTLLRTDQKGWIELTTDGNQMWVKVERR